MSNPFNKLRVHRDDDEVEVRAEAKTKAGPLFGAEEKTKKKVKPEKKEEKTEKNNDHHDTTGFEVVGKVKKTTYTKNDEEGNDKGEGKPGKKDVNHPHKQKRGEQVFRANGNKRVFDKHSGTGYDKKVKKEGFGGKHTWEGNKKQGYDYDDTDYYFNKALNPKPVKEEPVAETPVEEKTEVVVEAKVEAEVATEVKEGEGENQEKKWKGKKGKKPEENTEEDEKNKLEVPENAISLSDYKKTAKTTTNVEAKANQIQVDLEPVEKKVEAEIFIESNKKSGKGKKKGKEIDPKEAELTKMIGVNLKIEDSATRERKNYQNNDKKPKKFRGDDLPELK